MTAALKILFGAIFLWMTILACTELWGYGGAERIVSHRLLENAQAPS